MDLAVWSCVAVLKQGHVLTHSLHHKPGQGRTSLNICDVISALGDVDLCVVQVLRNAGAFEVPFAHALPPRLQLRRLPKVSSNLQNYPLQLILDDKDMYRERRPFGNSVSTYNTISRRFYQLYRIPIHSKYCLQHTTRLIFLCFVFSFLFDIHLKAGYVHEFHF